MSLEGFIFAPKAYYGSLTMRKGKIFSLSTRKTPKRIRKLILPGMISTHVHTIQTHARNHAENMELLTWLKKVIWPFEASLKAKGAYASASDGMKECLQFGITTILDMATTRHTDKVFEAARDVGIRGYIGKALMDSGPKELIDTHPLEELEELLADWHGKENGRLHVTLCPRFVLSCSEELLKKVGVLSRELQLLHHTHASENRAECEWIRKNYRASNIEILEKFGCLNERTILAHGVHLSTQDKQILKKRRVTLSHCPTSNLKLASGYADLMKLKGIALSLGVDGAPCNNRLDPFFEMRLAHLLSRYHHGLKGMSAKRIFELATLSGARALHAERYIGSLETGKRADIVVMNVPDLVEFNPDFPYESLLHSLSAADVHSVYVDGRKVFTRF